MGKKRKSTVPQSQNAEKKIVSRKMPIPDETSEAYFNDEIEQFSLKNDKILLEDGIDADKEDSDEFEYEDEGGEVLKLDNESSDDDIEEEKGSDDEDESEDEEDEESALPSTKAWGKKKNQFYSSDVKDIDNFGNNEEDEFAAEEEEKEALSLQQRMLSKLSQEDFDQFDIKEKPSKDQEEETDLQEDESYVTKDLSKLSKEEKLQIIIKESPELFELLDDYQAKLSDVINKYHPLLLFSRNGNEEISSEGVEFIEVMHHLLLNYCVNINFYLALKANNENVKDHPVIETLVEYRNLISKLEPVAKNLDDEMKKILSNATDKQAAPKQDVIVSKRDEDVNLAFETAKAMENIILKKTKKRKTEKVNVNPTMPKMDPLEYYNQIASQIQAKKVKKASRNEDEDLEPEIETALDEEGNDTKRAITYEMQKNKGLTRKRKKELNNPRVKHKMKFKKAIVKRKSQVPQIRNEAGSYGGEFTGIKSDVSKSVKIKYS